MRVLHCHKFLFGYLQKKVSKYMVKSEFKSINLQPSYFVSMSDGKFHILKKQAYWSGSCSFSDDSLMSSPNDIISFYFSVMIFSR